LPALTYSFWRAEVSVRNVYSETSGGKMKNSNQRVGIFIDVQNMYHSAKSLYGARVNFSEIIKSALSKRMLIRAIAYATRAQIPEEEGFFDALRKAGIEVKLKELQTFVGGVKKGNWDVGMAVDMIKLSSKLDVIILVSGDGDFELVLDHVQAAGCRAEVVSFKKSTSTKLIEAADDYIDLDKNYSRYTINIPQRSRRART